MPIAAQNSAKESPHRSWKFSSLKIAKLLADSKKSQASANSFNLCLHEDFFKILKGDCWHLDSVLDIQLLVDRNLVINGYTGPGGRDPDQSRITQVENFDGRNLMAMRRTRFFKNTQEERTYNLDTVLKDGGIWLLNEDMKEVPAGIEIHSNFKTYEDFCRLLKTYEDF